MHLFYVVGALDIKKIEKNEYFCMCQFFPDFFPIFSDFSPRRFNPDRDFQNIVLHDLQRTTFTLGITNA